MTKIDPPLIVAEQASPVEVAVANLTRVIDGHFRQLYDSKRDIWKQAGYPVAIGFNEYLSLYERGGVAGTIIDKIVETTWRRLPEITDDEGAGDTAFSDAWRALEERVRIRAAMELVDKQARIGRYAVLFIGTRVVDRQLAQPIGTGEVLEYLQPYDEGRTTIAKWEADPSSPRFGLPAAYTFQTSNTVNGFAPSISSLNVDASRTVHVAEGLLQDRVYGRPALKRAFNDLIDYQKITSSTAEAFWQRVVGIIQGIVDKDATIEPKEQTAYVEAVGEVLNGLKRTIVQKGIKLEQLNGDEPNPEYAAKLLERRLAAATEYPVRVLFGSETGERASTEDMKAYLGTVSERQVNHAEPVILRPLIDRLIRIGALPKPKKGRYTVVWPTLFEETELAQAEANKNRAEAAKALTPVGGDPLMLVEIDERRNIWLVPREAGAKSPFALLEPEDTGAGTGTDGAADGDDGDDDGLEDDSE